MESNHMDMFFKRLGDLVNQRRRELGLSQADLAKSAGIHRTYVSDIENGKRNVSLGTLYALSDSLGIPVAKLLAKSESPEGGTVY